MRTITTFATKGGAGRTITTMALASGFLAQGKRVRVMDCTDLAGSNPKGRHPSTLQNWMTQMAACKFRAPQLELIECQTREEVEDRTAAAEADGIDVLLIDTSARLYEKQLAALGLADLIIAPAISPFEAKCIVAGISEYLGTPEDLMCLVNGCRNGALEAAETRNAFGYPYEILGLQPGDPLDDVLAVYAERSDAAPTSESEVLRVQSPDGAVFEFTYQQFSRIFF